MKVDRDLLDTTDSQGWHPEDIKAALRKKGITAVALSRQHGYAANAVGMAIRGARVSRPLQRIVARALGVPIQELWPARKKAS